MNEQMAKEAK